MDSQYLVFWLEAFLCVWLSHAATVSENFVVSVNANVSVYTKETAVLPCWLSPQQTAEDMEVNWFHLDQFNAPVMLYKDKVISSASQPSYSGRVSFGQKHASSAGLKEGDVTLKLVNVTLADAGKYTCYVSSDKHHDRASVNLLVSQIGVTPLLTAVVKENNKLNVSCESEGWYPKPHLQWSNDRGALKTKDLVYRKASSGLLSVHSWIIVDSSSALSCSVGLPGEEAVQGRIHVTPVSQIQEDSITGWVLFAITAVALVAVLGFLLLLLKKYRGKGKPASTEDPGELENLLSDVPDTAVKNYENIQLEESNNKFLKIHKNKLRDADVVFPDGDSVTCITAVRGTTGFTSERHYWEVALFLNGVKNVPTKKSWWIGVTSLSEFSPTNPTTENGFWFLSSSPDNPGVLQFNSNPAILLPIKAQPEKIGVLLDYDCGKLEFYNVQSNCLIGSFKTKFSGPVFPLFNPGKGDQSPMEIIHRSPAVARDPDDKHIGTLEETIVDNVTS